MRGNRFWTTRPVYPDKQSPNVSFERFAISFPDTRPILSFSPADRFAASLHSKRIPPRTYTCAPRDIQSGHKFAPQNATASHGLRELISTLRSVARCRHYFAKIHAALCGNNANGGDRTFNFYHPRASFVLQILFRDVKSEQSCEL